MPISIGYEAGSNVRIVAERFHYGSQAESLKLIYRLFRTLGANSALRFAETHEELGKEGPVMITTLSLAGDELKLLLRGPAGYDGAPESKDYTDDPRGSVYSLYCVYKIDLKARMEPNFDIVMDIVMNHRLRMLPIMIEGTISFTDDNDYDFEDGHPGR